MTASQLPATTCPTCSGELSPGARFCIHCGGEIGGESGNDVYGGMPQPASTFVNPFLCTTCGGDGSLLASERVYCPRCRWLRPLGAEYRVDTDAFMWRLDAEAMAVLRGLGPLTAVAQEISERVGRPWFEASVNGIRLSERQFPDIFEIAIRAARILSLSHLPEIYISGDAMWDAVTMGTENSAFIVLGSVLMNFRGDDLFYVIAREMGHCQAGHALWRTVMQFMSGRSQSRSVLGGGVLKLLNPVKLVQSALDAPLMAWSRHSEITADRAGMLAVRNEEVARRVLMSWNLKSFPLYARINQDEWREQELQSDEVTQRMAEWTLASTPFIAGRLKQVRDFAAAEEYSAWKRFIDHYAPVMPASTLERASNATPPRTAAKASVPDLNVIRLTCVQCKAAMRIPKAVMEGKESVNVRCPNPECRKVLTLRVRPVPVRLPTEIVPRVPEPAAVPGPEALTPA
jgi:Zn-dependent protease with chaperone function